MSEISANNLLGTKSATTYTGCDKFSSHDDSRIPLAIAIPTEEEEDKTDLLKLLKAHLPGTIHVCWDENKSPTTSTLQLYGCGEINGVWPKDLSSSSDVYDKMALSHKSGRPDLQHVILSQDSNAHVISCMTSQEVHGLHLGSPNGWNSLLVPRRVDLMGPTTKYESHLGNWSLTVAQRPVIQVDGTTRPIEK